MKEYHVALNSKTLEQTLRYIQKNEYVAFDIETDSEEESRAQVIGIGISCQPMEGVYIPLAKWNKKKEQLERLHSAEFELDFIKRLTDLLLTKKLIMQNGVYDIVVMWYYYNILLTPALYCDTILLKHTIDEECPFSLKKLARLYASYIGYESEEEADLEQQELRESVKANGGRWTKNHKDMYKADLEVISKYGAADADITIRLFDYLEGKLYDEGLDNFFYNEEVMPLYKKCTIPMKMRGLYVDVPYFEKLRDETEANIEHLTTEIFKKIGSDITPLVREIVDKYIKTTRSGRFACAVFEYYGIEPPINPKTGMISFSKPLLAKYQTEIGENKAFDFVIHKKDLPDHVEFEIKKKLYIENNPSKPYIFNLNSNKHLGWLLFKHYKCEPISRTRETNAPQITKTTLPHYSEIPFVEDLLALKKEEKQLSTYIKPILEKNIDGWIYPSLFQFGTTSGRYSCGGGLNLQTLPRDDVRIKKGFIAPSGYKIVSADFASLEPRCFSWVSTEPKLKALWEKALDLYSDVAINVFELEGVSSDPKAENYLKKVNKGKRQESKIFCLATVYGISAWKLANDMGLSVEEAQDVIDKYLDEYPYLRDYMQNQEFLAKQFGYVETKFGRRRHLEDVQRLYRKYGELLSTKWLMKNRYGENGVTLYYKYKTLLNNAKNFPIQATAAHVTNHAMIKMADLLKEHNIDGWIALQVHDEIVCIVKEDAAEKASDLLRDAMENNYITNQIDIPMVAEPEIGNNLAEVK